MKSVHLEEVEIQLSMYKYISVCMVQLSTHLLPSQRANTTNKGRQDLGGV